MNGKTRAILALWLALALLSAAGTVLTFFNWWAACDLGYDRTPQGKRMIVAWFYSMVGTFVVSMVSAVLGARTLMKSRVPSIAQGTGDT